VLDFGRGASRLKHDWSVEITLLQYQWVAGGSACRGGHKIYIWNRTTLLKILEGPEESIVDFAWHPLSPIAVSVSFTGQLYIRGKVFTDKCSAYVPNNFEEMGEKGEYVEGQNEFNSSCPETEKVR